MNARLPSISAGGSRNALLLKRPVQISAPSQRPIEWVESFLDPLALIGSLWALALYFEGRVSNPYLLLGIVVFSMTFPSPSYLRVSWPRMIGRVVLGSATIGALLFVFGYATRLIEEFDPNVLVQWLWSTSSAR